MGEQVVERMLHLRRRNVQASSLPPSPELFDKLLEQAEEAARMGETRVATEAYRYLHAVKIDAETRETNSDRYGTSDASLHTAPTIPPTPCDDTRSV